MQRRALAIATACAWTAALGACKKAPPPAPPTPVVHVATLRTHNIEQIREWLATLDGSTNAEIRPQVSGYIEELSYQEGSAVQNGALLFRLDHRPFVAAVEKAKGDLANAQAQLNRAREDMTRYAPLVAQRALSKEELTHAQDSARAASATLQAMQGALAIAKLNLEWADVRSPIDGLAGIAQTRVGNLVGPNNVLTVVSTLDPIRSSINISEREYLGVAERLNHVNEPRYANARIIELILIDGRVHPYRVRRVIVNRQIDPSTGTLLVQALFPNPGNILRPGMFTKVRVHSGAQEDVVLVPERAVQELQGRHMVGVIGPDGRVEIRTVTLGRQLDHSYVVEKGLQKGEKIIVEGLQNVQPGAKVNAQEEEQPAQAAAEPRPGP